MDDILNQLDELANDPLFQLSETEQDLFQLSAPLKKNAKKHLQAEYVAQRRPCEHFELYEPLFKQVHADLQSGKRKLVKFTYASLKEGTFLVIGGVMVYIAKLYDSRKPNTSHFAFDGRTLTIYENGMESNVMVQTLGKSAYADGYTVSQPDEDAEQILHSNMGLLPEDKKDGYIYVLSSLSTDPQITSITNLYKIGFSTVPVQQRIANAEHEPTYLCAKVKIEEIWSTYNLKTEVLETLLHQFFQSAQLQITIRDNNGNKVIPKEWYIVPLPIIVKAIEYIIDGSIIHYRYNSALQVIEQVEPSTNHIEQEKDSHILTLYTKKDIFDSIRTKTVHTYSCEIKESTLNRYTWVDTSTGTRYLRKFDALQLITKEQSPRFLIIEVINTVFIASTNSVQYQLGNILKSGIKA